MKKQGDREKKTKKDILLAIKEDRRILPNVPDKLQRRSILDRRGRVSTTDAKYTIDEYIKSARAGIRYRVDYDVKVICKSGGKKRVFWGKGVDISMTGILLKVAEREELNSLVTADSIKLIFNITPGSMPEGMEMGVKIFANVARTSADAEGGFYCGLQFNEHLSVYSAKKKDKYLLAITSLFLFFITAFIMLMRAESIIYFKFNKTIYSYSIIAAIFLLSRYLFAAFYRPVPIDVEFTPGVSIIIPCFNEEEWIQKTILGCMNQDYPLDKLEVIVVDDCSTDKSPEKIKEIVKQIHEEGEIFNTRERLKYILQKKNGGKRKALARGILEAKHELVVFVDSDSLLDPFAIRNLVQPFKDPKMGGVSGRTDVANTYTNALTKMQSVRYYIAFRVMKAAESVFDAVTCLSGPLSCYRKEIVLENLDQWLGQKFLGHEATFGDDRAMTNLVLRKYRTAYQDSAICRTIVPNTHRVFLKQQMRWKRSWLRESLSAASYMWRKEPFAAFTFYLGLIVPILGPVVVVYNLAYVPLVHRVFPATFLVGLLLMSMLMSLAELRLRKSSTWLFGLLFCLYYEFVLLWQMPIAWFTFWKTTWGTRMTPNDVEALAKRGKRGNVFSSS